MTSLQASHDLSSLKVLGTVGEPINPEVWQWYKKTVGAGTKPIVDTWWQTETGGIMISPLPNVTDEKAGSATKPLYGIEPVLLDASGKEQDGNNTEGLLFIKRPWPGQARTIYEDHQRYIHTYFPYASANEHPELKHHYFTGDGAKRDGDGYYWITGRVDDVINVSGHRLGTAEIESALVAHDAVVEAAVVPIEHEIKGQGIAAFVIVNEASQDMGATLRGRVREAIGPIATPDKIFVTQGLPKTRSGKIMRRILRKIANGDADNLGDLSTLADPAVVDGLKTLAAQ